MKISWHSLPLTDVFGELASSEAGLSQDAARTRLETVGPNALPEEKGNSALHLLLSQFVSPLMLIMMLATVVSFFLGNTTEGWFILFVMTSNALVGFYQEYKANESLKTLKGIIQPKARVVRESKEYEIDATQIVPGDVIILRAGDRVPADGRVIQCKGLKVSEATLTGESKPVEKNNGSVATDAEVGDRTNMVFMGTFVEEGSATAVVTETGKTTEYGDVVLLLKDTEEEATPLQKMVVSLSKFIGIFITCVVGFIVLEGYLAGNDIRVIFETALALFVSAIPEGLLPGITIVLVLGMRRILKERGLVRRLAATETLGGVTVICTDKTGTLTEGKMEATSILTMSGARSIQEASSFDDASMAMRVGIMATDAYIENPGASQGDLIVRGNLTEQALLRMGVRAGKDPYAIQQEEKVVDSILFSSERKYSASLRQQANGSRVLYVLGAPEVLMGAMGNALLDDGQTEALGEHVQALVAKKDELVAKGYRVVVCAYRTFQEGEQIGELEKEVRLLTLVGFIAISDPVRADVPEAFVKTRRAGIRTVIVTGDHALTALSVARSIGIPIAENEILQGHDIETMSDEELVIRSKTVALYARVSPRHKLRIVHALQTNGEVVAMFGDGVNDAPALKMADIGVAVDTRVSVAREVADIVLLDGGFGTIIKAIEQGRIIFQNIRKVFLYLIVQDFSQFFIFIVAIFLGLPLPLIASQLLLVNLVESGLPDLALTTEQEKEGVMEEKPRDPKESILSRQAKIFMLSVFLISGLIALVLYIHLIGVYDITTTRTMMTVFLCMESVMLVFSMRSFKQGVLRRNIFSNKILTSAVVLSFGMVLAAVYMPQLQKALSLVPLTLSQWVMLLFVNIVEILLIDRFKLRIFRKKQ